MNDESPNRRDLLRRAAASAVLLPAAARGANDRPAYGLIGSGSRGRYLNNAMQKLGARCMALCDVYKPNLELAKKDSPPGVKTFGDHRDLLAMKGLDFVVIGTPDHHHRPMLVDALAAKLDVYLEKPLSMSLEESALMVEATRKSGRIVQIGMHRRSMAFIREARRVIQEGALGEITQVETIWNWHFALPLDNRPLEGELDWARFLGPAPKRPLEPRRFRWWRGFWDYSGGNMTDQGTHLLDVVQWMTESGPPQSAVCQGKLIDAEGAEVPNVFSAVFEYPKFLATWTLNYRSNYEHDWWVVFRGEKGTMVMNRAGYRLYEDEGATPQPWSQRPKNEPARTVPDTDKPEAHQANFLEAIRNRTEPSCPIEVGAAAVAGPHLANLAYKEGRKVRLNALGRAS